MVVGADLPKKKKKKIDDNFINSARTSSLLQNVEIIERRTDNVISVLLSKQIEYNVLLFRSFIN